MKKVLIYFITEKDKFAKTYMNVPMVTLNQPKRDMLYDLSMLLYKVKQVPVANFVAYKIPKH